MTSIFDETAGAPVASNATVASSPWARFCGLMLRSSFGPHDGLILRPCGSIHMMFMRFAIDAVFFDRDGNVTRVARDLKPWLGLAFGGRGAHGVIELPMGSAASVKSGDRLRFDE